MKNNKKTVNLFLAHTEFHIMVSVHIALKCYSSEKYTNQIYYTKHRERLNKLLINSKVGNNIIIKGLNYEPEKEHVKFLENITCERFFFFQEHSIFNIYIIKKLKKKGVSIILLEDGAKAYQRNEKKQKFILILKNTLKNYIALLHSRLLLFDFFLINTQKYGSNKYIDEIWLFYPELFDLMKINDKKRIFQVPKLDNNSLYLISNLFNYHPEDFILDKQVVFYLNQPFDFPEMQNIEINFIEKLSTKFKDSHLIIKLHPLSQHDAIKKYGSLPNVIIIKSNIPAELYISSLHSSIVIAICSTALFFNNPACNFYYIYPIYSNVYKIDLKFPNHIKLVHSVDDLSFPHLLNNVKLYSNIL